MATGTTSLVYTRTGAVSNWAAEAGAGAQAFISGISTLLANAGAVRTTDSGQINTAAIPPAPTAVGAQSWGFEVYQFTDQLQATEPLLIKVMYRGSTTSVTAGATAHNAYWVAVQVGGATDGAGNLIGDGVSSVLHMGFSNSSSNTSTAAYDATSLGVARPFEASCGSGHFLLFCATGGGFSGHPGVGNVGIERLRDRDTGLATSRGWALMHWGSGPDERISSGFSQIRVTHMTWNRARNQFCSATSHYTAGPHYFLTPPPSNIGYAADLDVAVHPAIPHDPLPCGQATLWLAYSTANFATNEEHDINVNGQTFHYRFMGGAYVVPGGYGLAIAARWQ